MNDTLSEDIASRQPEALRPETPAEASGRPEAQGEWLRKFEAARQLGRTIVTLAGERQAEGLTPYLAVDTLPETYRAVVANTDLQHPLSEDDVDRVRRASLGLSIEAT